MEQAPKRHIAILGSTGSIGTQALDVIGRHEDRFQVELLTANNNSRLLIEQARRFNPSAVVICTSICAPTAANAASAIRRTRMSFILMRRLYQILVVSG